ncbi:hypothetical protein [Dactylosporangium sp. CA-233914]|uniref:hypothetical protein n=1 Tax=Dactylosporangium sp. CA-233914 TaxID=3239934 RepID=UPI003D91D0B5
MDVSGTWNLIVDSPMGKQDVSLRVVADNGVLTGTLINNAYKMESEIFDGAVTDDRVQWKVKLQRAPVTLSFGGVVTGDTMTGSAKTGMFGKFAFSGRRI